MKAQKELLIKTLWGFITTLIISIFMYLLSKGYVSKLGIPKTSELFFNIASSLSAGFFIASLTAWIMYTMEKNKLIYQYFLKLVWLQSYINNFDFRVKMNKKLMDIPDYNQLFIVSNFSKIEECAINIMQDVNVREMEDKKTEDIFIKIILNLHLIIDWSSNSGIIQSMIKNKSFDKRYEVIEIEKYEQIIEEILILYLPLFKNRQTIEFLKNQYNIKMT